MICEAILESIPCEFGYCLQILSIQVVSENN